MATMTATELRSRLYETLHRIHATGETIEVELKGERFLISRAEPVDRLALLEPHPGAVAGSDEDLDSFSPWDEPEWRQRWSGQ
ncbi:MAG: hypothetical protein U0821_15715 [Chloroflexota bacterium]